MNHLLRLTLLGVGAMNSPRFAPAGLLLRCPGHRVAFDGGPGAEPPPGRLDAWLVTDEQAELRSELRRRAVGRGVSVRAGDLELDGVRVRCCPVAHTSHPAYGYRIEAGALVVAWAPEFWEFPRWAQRADLMFAEAMRLGPADTVPGWRGRPYVRKERQRAGGAVRGAATGVRAYRAAHAAGDRRRVEASGR